MQKQQHFLKAVCAIAVPVALQSMLQASFSIVDQIMIGQLGSVSVAGVGFAGKFSSIYSVTVAAIGTVGGIMISQYMGQRNQWEVRRSFCLNLWFALGLAAVDAGVSLAFPKSIIGLYTTDSLTVTASASYLRLIAWTFVPAAAATMLSTLFRCMEKAQLPLYASIAASLLNTGLNYLLIFGKLGLPRMGAEGAAIATVIAQLANALIMLLLLVRHREALQKAPDAQKSRFAWKQYAKMLLPILVCEFMWSIGENVYAAIYGHIGTEASAAMTLVNPVQGLMIGALCGLSQAAGVIIGKRLGKGSYDEAYAAAKRLILYGFVGSLALSLVIVATSGLYAEIYRVEPSVKTLTTQILLAYALIAPFKVQNMIVSGGILRSGGKTTYVMVIDLIGTWIFGVPLGWIAAFVLRLSIPYVYFILSLEECVRFGISLLVLRKKKWMQSLGAAPQA